MSPSRALPEPSELFEFVTSAMLAYSGGIEVTTVLASGGKLEGFGRTSEGQDFAFAIPLTEVNIWRIDD